MGMYKRLAVALDGSSQAEKILPLAVQLANLLNAEILLLHVCMEQEPPEETKHDGQKKTAREFDPPAYLEEIKKSLTDPAKTGLLPPERVLSKVLYGKLAYELGDLAVSEGADLLLMTTHGRSGLSLLTMGSIATGVLKHSRHPLLLFRPQDTVISLADAVKAFKTRPPIQILLTLDGTPKAEAALEPALHIASELNLPLHLVEVIYPVAPIIMSEPGMNYQILADIEEYEEKAQAEIASKYLRKVEDWLKERVPTINVAITVLKGLPENQLTAFIHATKPFIVVMATHARNELGQLVLGSVAEGVLRKSHSPVLMVPIPKEFKGYELQVEEEEETETESKPAGVAVQKN